MWEASDLRGRNGSTVLRALFCVAMSAYDLVLAEDEEMVSLTLFVFTE